MSMQTETSEGKERMETEMEAYNPPASLFP